MNFLSKIFKKKQPVDCTYCNNTGWVEAMRIGSFMEFVTCHHCGWYEYNKNKS